MTFAWKLYVDWQADGTFDQAIDDISADFQANTEWFIGFRAPYQLVADEAEATVIVRNTDGKYNSENPASPLYGYLLPHRRIRIIADSGTQTTMYTGWIESISADWEPVGERTGEQSATLVCAGIKQILDEAETTLNLYTDTTGDVVIGDVLDQVADVTDYALIDVGNTTFALYGDSASGKKASAVITEITEGERGHFFQNPEGKAVWWNRHHLLAVLTCTGTVDSSGATGYKPTGIVYGNAKYLSNQVRVTVYQRQVAAVSSTLWKLDAPLTVPAGRTYDVEITLRNSNGQFASGTGLAVSGATYSQGTTTITVTEKGGKALLSFANAGTVDAILTALSVNGVPTIQQNIMTADVSDEASILAYGRRGGMDLNLPALSTFDQARGIANAELNLRKDPFAAVESLTFKNPADGVSNAHQLAWTIGTRICVVLPELHHNQDYYITGESHKIAPGVNGMHETTFILEKAGRAAWILGRAGYSELGVTTRLVY